MAGWPNYARAQVIVVSQLFYRITGGAGISGVGSQEFYPPSTHATNYVTDYLNESVAVLGARSSAELAIVANGNTVECRGGILCEVPSDQAGGAVASSACNITFSLNQYCRFDYSCEVSSSGTENPRGGMFNNSGGIWGSLTVPGPEFRGQLLSIGVTYASNNYEQYGFHTNGYLTWGSANLNGEADVQFFYSPSMMTALDWDYHCRLSVVPMGTRLVGLEVIQSIQDWSNSVPLVMGKPTWVRAHVEPVSEPSMGVDLELHGYVGSRELPDSPRKPEVANPFRALPNATNLDNRADWSRSANFWLPIDWTTNVYLNLELKGVGLMSTSNRPLTQSCHFWPSGVIKLHIGLAQYWDSARQAWFGCDSEAPAEMYRFFASMFPVACTNLQIADIEEIVLDEDLLWEMSSSYHGAARFAELISTEFEKDTTTGYKILFVPVVSDWNGGLVDNIPGQMTIINAGLMSHPATLAHEMAHLLGQFHTVNATRYGTQTFTKQPVPCWTDTVYACGFNGERVPFSKAKDFPFYDAENLPRIGPVTNGANSMVYGLEGYDWKSIDLMSYASGKRWISSLVYTQLMHAIVQQSPAKQASVLAANPPAEWSIVRGLYNATSDTFTLLPVVGATLTNYPVGSGGWDYLVYAYYREGAGINNVGSYFGVTYPQDTVGVWPLAEGYFSVPLQCPAKDIVKIDVMREYYVPLCTWEPSPHAPAISLEEPVRRQAATTDVLTLEWTASDGDGDPLTYMVEYSPDGGARWRTLSLDWPTNRFDLGPDMLPSSTNAILRVTASDGMNFSQVQTEPFSVTNRSLAVHLYSPSEGEHFAGNQGILLEAMVWGMGEEAAALEPVWSSSLDGPLGQGSRLELTASGLSEGTHLISAIAGDSFGVSATAQVSIAVTRLPPGRIDRVAMATNGQVTVQVIGDPACRHVLEASTNLLDPEGWAGVDTNADPMPSFHLTLAPTNESALPKQFLRIRSQLP